MKAAALLAGGLAALAVLGTGAALAAPLLLDRVAFAGAYLDLPERAAPADVEVLWLERPGARLEGWLVRPAGRGPAPAILYFHGNAELIDTNLELARTYAAQGYAVLLAEYRGYGRSTGRPASDVLPDDARAFYDVLAAAPGIDPARIAVVGRSLGGGAAAAVAAERPACALALESTFTSLSSLVRSAGFPPALAGGRLNSAAALRAYAGPVLVLHGATDDVIPFAHGEALARIAAERGVSRFVRFPGAHNPMAPFPEIAQALTGFLIAETPCAPLAGS